jgi:RNA polymerase sigma-70 factor (ECF subfamily)
VFGLTPLSAEELLDATTAELIDSAVAGNSDALALLLFRSNDRLTQFVRPRLGARLAAHYSVEDAVQDTFEQAFRTIATAEFADEASFHAWLTKIAHHRLLDAAKRRKAKKRGGEFRRVSPTSEEFGSRAFDLVAEISCGGATPSQFVARHEAVDAMQIAISGLSREQRQAIRLRYFELKTVAEVAEIMDRSAGSVRGLLQRAKESLRQSLHKSSLWLSKKR